MKPLIFSMLLIPAATTWAQTLRQEADRTGVLVRTAVQPTQLSEIPYASTLAREFNMLEPENDLKWAALRPDQKTFDFTKADQIVGFARVHGLKVRGHTLVWGWSNPSWLVEQHFTPQQLSTCCWSASPVSSPAIVARSSPRMSSTKPSTSTDIYALPSGTTSPASGWPAKGPRTSNKSSAGRTLPIRMRSSSITITAAKPSIPKSDAV
jgi:hypothetical protein